MSRSETNLRNVGPWKRVGETGKACYRTTWRRSAKAVAMYSYVKGLSEECDSSLAERSTTSIVRSTAESKEVVGVDNTGDGMWEALATGGTIGIAGVDLLGW